MQLAASLPLLLLALSSTASARRPASIHERQLVPASQHSHGHLFTRQSTTSPGAKMAYPEAGDTAPGKDTLPQAWIDAYDKAKGAGLIPDIPASTENAAGTVDYPSGTDMTKACSWSVSKCDTGDIWLGASTLFLASTCRCFLLPSSNVLLPSNCYPPTQPRPAMRASRSTMVQRPNRPTWSSTWSKTHRAPHTSSSEVRSTGTRTSCRPWRAPIPLVSARARAF